MKTASATTVDVLTEPLVFAPYARPQVWGARRLASALGKALPDAGTYGESWELCSLAPYESTVTEGRLAGLTLPDLWDQFRDQLCNGRPVHPSSFPWLIKWLDCADWLSVQVHPDEAKSLKWLGTSTPKSETWVVVAVEPDARIYAGFRGGVTADDVRRRLIDGSLVESLHVFTPCVGDCINLPAGTVHAVGGGVLLAEVQQPSDATFRLFDWNRCGRDGKPRELHLDAALDALSWPQPPVEPVVPQRWDCGESEVVAEHLVTTSFARLDRFTVDRSFHTPCDELAAWMVLHGTAELDWATGSRICPAGATLLMPASGQEIIWRAVDAQLQLLRITLPA